MTPKEKAEELVYKYRLTDLNPQDFTDFCFNLSVINSKECALICVEQMIEACEGYIKGIKYWQDVKQEINKI